MELEISPKDGGLLECSDYKGRLWIEVGNSTDQAFTTLDKTEAQKLRTFIDEWLNQL